VYSKTAPVLRAGAATAKIPASLLAKTDKIQEKYREPLILLAG
jgi:hypothetical protein